MNGFRRGQKKVYVARLHTVAEHEITQRKETPPHSHFHGAAMNKGAAAGYRVLRNGREQMGAIREIEPGQRGRFACFAWLPLELSAVVLVRVEV